MFVVFPWTEDRDWGEPVSSGDSRGAAGDGGRLHLPGGERGRLGNLNRHVERATRDAVGDHRSAGTRFAPIRQARREPQSHGRRESHFHVPGKEVSQTFLWNSPRPGSFSTYNETHPYR